jgi:hypothetical protein
LQIEGSANASPAEFSETGRSHVRNRAAVLLAAIVAVLAITGSAFAFDCIRVSSSLQGLQQSTRTGNWTLFNLSSAQATGDTLAQFGLPSSAGACVYAHYSAVAGLPAYFALGTGVAGGNTNGPGVLAHNNPNDAVLGNLQGIDHLDDSPIGAALDAAVFTCLGIHPGG